MNDDGFPRGDASSDVRSTADTVTEQVSLGDATATASLRGRGVASIPSVSDATAARAWLLLAETFAADGHAGLATVAALRGVDRLSDAHRQQADPRVRDHTRTKLLAAEDADDDSVRAALVGGVLEARLQMYLWAHEEAGPAFEPPINPDDHDPDDAGEDR